jgi:hypothetical protein
MAPSDAVLRDRPVSNSAPTKRALVNFVGRAWSYHFGTCARTSGETQIGKAFYNGGGQRHGPPPLVR